MLIKYSNSLDISQLCQLRQPVETMGIISSHLGFQPLNFALSSSCILRPECYWYLRVINTKTMTAVALS